MTQPQQVVVMQQMGQPQTVGTVNGGETNQQPQTVVVVQQQPAGTTTATQDGDRYPRWAYCVFGVGFWVYHFLWFWFWLTVSIFTNGVPGYGALFFFCGFVPALINVVWMINDSTVFCANPGTGPVTKICCCACINPWVMAIPMAISALLRFILWCSMFGIFADLLDEVEGGDEAIDNFFWFFLSFCALDCGPCVYLAVDWYYYYGRQDYCAILGTKYTPLRCCVAQQIVVMIISWAFIAVFEELSDNPARDFWPWLLHGIVSTAILVYAAFLNFSGSLKGATVTNVLFKFICWGLGIAALVLNLIIWGYFLSWAFAGWSNAFFTIFLLIYGLYFSGLTVPTVWALFSFKEGDVDQV